MLNRFSYSKISLGTHDAKPAYTFNPISLHQRRGPFSPSRTCTAHKVHHSPWIATENESRCLVPDLVFAFIRDDSANSANNGRYVLYFSIAFDDALRRAML